MLMDNNKRKRVNRIKTAIILLIILMLILPTIFCVFLGLKIGQLQKQVNELAAAHGLTEYSEKKTDGNYVYAAIKTSDTLKQAYAILTPPAAQYYNDTVNNQEKEKSIQEQLDTDKKKNDINTINKDNDSSNKSDPARKEGIYSGKKVYLTFDDGPSIYTDKILDILDKYHVKATFFVIGKTDKRSKEQYKRIVNEGHTLGMHSYSHNYEQLYNSVEDFDKDFTKLRKLLYDITGYKPSIYRFPGGSDNLVNENGMNKFIHDLNKKSIVYFDWNVVNGDATRITYTKGQLVRNILDGVAKKDRAIVLMHDTQAKKSTVDSLPKLIKALKKGGAQLLPLNKNVTPIQMIKADSIK